MWIDMFGKERYFCYKISTKIKILSEKDKVTKWEQKSRLYWIINPKKWFDAWVYPFRSDINI